MNIEDILTYLITIALVTAFILIVTGKFLDLKVEKVSSDQFRAAENILQLIVTSGPLLVKDSSGFPIKDMFYTSDTGASLIDCCGISQYDYELYIQNTGGVVIHKNDINNVNVKFPYFNDNSYCYLATNLLRTEQAQLPVNLCSNQYSCSGNAMASLNLTRTPLSELSYWLSRACTESSFPPPPCSSFNNNPVGCGNQLGCSYDSNTNLCSVSTIFSQTIIFDVDEVRKISLDNSNPNNKQVCINFVDGRQICKRYYCDKNNEAVSSDPPNPQELVPKQYSPYGTLGNSATCSFARVRLDNGQVFLDLGNSIRTGSYQWIQPKSCETGTALGGWGIGDISKSAWAPLAGKCAGGLISGCCAWAGGDVGSDLITYGRHNDFFISSVDENWYNTANDHSEVSSISQSDSKGVHGYLWESFSVGNTKSAVECCGSSGCNSDNNDGFRVPLNNLLTSSTNNGEFNQAWCGGNSNNCLLCAPDQSQNPIDSKNTKWYVCGGSNIPIGYGAENVNDPVRVIANLKCTANGWA